ncbi:hypothetical protein KIN20_009971 [Parelaphostrongylus tenuis]|uniref:7TM GPCR serpentine receptor class x (Srx) domain-containing protein n=1 Tax=Parelaphostrongylus tenuis TaxID=148309 RepID=A0AAD5MRA7_PARTN|nr:hypothetical protein KIN20_009971 [Parelaphostrongylus tenuis]
MVLQICPLMLNDVENIDVRLNSTCISPFPGGYAQAIEGKKSRNPDCIFSNVTQQKRKEMELRFLKQTVCQNTVLIFHEVVLFYICPRLQSKWAIFLASTFLWALFHALDGLIVVLFHFRRSYFGVKWSGTKTTVTKIFHAQVNKQAKALFDSVKHGKK